MTLDRNKNDRRKVAKHSVVYQIIGGRLYRSPEKCLFPLRCTGVEHFLIKGQYLYDISNRDNNFKPLLSLPFYLNFVYIGLQR